MLRRLLADRFKLALHRETKDYPIYALTVGKTGSRVRQSSGDDTQPGTKISKGHVELRKVSMQRFAEVVEIVGKPDRPIVDKTQLPGLFDFMLDWMPDNMSFVDSSALPTGPSLFTAIQEQLGLKLGAEKAAMEFIIVDHVEEPTEN
jgi:uncharacterized protein (TIGR03435 family)